ncbi:MBL fold metallo-hydrolase [Thalassobacillus hwangdonensis]|uniref:MBL fold metallo-hydrolase n=1 Tax=Thalassobacillus hwangdonensis TaxID=546108 RepID=A0ABW3KYB1_9BACI
MDYKSRHFNLHKVEKGIYAAIAKEGGGAVANAGIIDLGDKTIIFDTFNTPQAAEDLRKAAESICKSPISYVVNSHYHGDHVRGNQVFNDATIVSSTITFEKMEEIHPERIRNQKNDLAGLEKYIETLEEKNDQSFGSQISFLKEIRKSLPDLELVLPTKTFKESFKIVGSERNARLVTYGRAHSYCDAVLFVEGVQVVFTGDLLFVEGHPTFFEESDLDLWLEKLKFLESEDIKSFVPGHGEIGTKDDVLTMITYMNDVKTVASTPSLNNEMLQKYKEWGEQGWEKNVKLILEKMD